MKNNNILGTIVGLYIIATVAPIVIGGAVTLVEITAGGIDSTVKKVIANNKIKKAFKEKNKDIIDVKYYAV